MEFQRQEGNVYASVEISNASRPRDLDRIPWPAGMIYLAVSCKGQAGKRCRKKAAVY